MGMLYEVAMLLLVMRRCGSGGRFSSGRNGRECQIAAASI